MDITGGAGGSTWGEAAVIALHGPRKSKFRSKKRATLGDRFCDVLYASQWQTSGVRLARDPSHCPTAGDTIIEKSERYLGEHGNVGFACVLLTPDDEGHPAGEPDHKRYRARQNVVLEMGMVLARLGRRRVAILHKQSIELPSDIAGLIWIGFQERLEEARARLFNELREAGYNPDPSALP